MVHLGRSGELKKLLNAEKVTSHSRIAYGTPCPAPLLIQGSGLRAGQQLQRADVLQKTGVNRYVRPSVTDFRLVRI